MVQAVTLKTLGNWNKEVGVGLSQALAVSMDVSGRSGEQACRRALILMAQSARKLAKQARKNRKVQRDEHGRYVENYRAGKADFQKIYKWMFDEDRKGEGGLIPGTWEDARRVGNRGLAKRSWMWGLAKLGGKKTGAAIRGTSRVASIRHETVSGYIKENKLDYILKAMPHGWERQVEVSAGNKIMAQARNKLEKKWRRAMKMPKGVKPTAKQLSTYFLANP